MLEENVSFLRVKNIIRVKKKKKKKDKDKA